jgi:RNA polymerase sigma-70 factor (ECF subfamily)
VRTVSGLCRALLRDRAEAEDATQQTFLSAHRALLSGTDPREPAAWLATIARNECWSRIRGRMREPLAVSELETASTEADPLAEAIRRADLAALWSAITELPRPQRDALLLREFGGLSYGELSEALAVSGPAVESLLFRARQHLRVQLRAAYASLGGASWLESLARLFGGAPVAAKVAAIGVGAATVTGSAVVVPSVLEQSRRPIPSAHVHASATRAPKLRAVVATARPVVLAAGQTRASRPVISHNASPVEKPVSHDTSEAVQNDGSEGGVRAPVQQPAQRETSGSRDEAGVSAQTETVQTELQPPATTAESDGGSSGSDGSSGGSDGVSSPVD